MSEHDTTTRDTTGAALSNFIYDRQREQREHLRNEGRAILSRAHINLADNIAITNGGHGRTITATFNVPTGPQIPTIAEISISVRFSWSDCEDAVRGLDAVLTAITSALDPEMKAGS